MQTNTVASPDKSLEPLYTLEVAVELIPMVSKSSLQQFLFRHKLEFPPHYKRVSWYEVRMLPLSEIVKIREMTILKRGESRYERWGAADAKPEKFAVKTGLEKYENSPKHVKTQSNGTPLARIMRLASAAR